MAVQHGEKKHFKINHVVKLFSLCFLGLLLFVDLDHLMQQDVNRCYCMCAIITVFLPLASVNAGFDK